MISSKLVAESVLSSIEQPSLESVEITQISSVERFLENSHRIVATYTDLPDVIENTGRIMYVQDEDEHYFSNGVFWSKDYSSDEGLMLSETLAWGSNSQGQLGDGTTVSKSSPVSVIGGITNWSQVSAGSYHSLGVTSYGIAWAWGSNGQGQLGDGTTVSKTSPVSVIGGITNWSQVSAGDRHSLGVTSSGIAWAWGFNSQGRLGDGTTVAKTSPVSVIGGITDWSQVSAGYRHSLGVTSSGIAWAWGRR